jgi:glycerate dehydrogenase
MKIVILDGYTLNPGDLSWDGLKKLGEVTCYDRTKSEDIIKRIGDAEIIITNKTPITEETIHKCSNIKYIGVLATGYNVVDTLAAREKGIPVCNVPTYGTTAVSQFVFAMLLEICHHVQHHSSTVKDLKWTHSEDFCYWDYPLIELAGKTMGIIGFGRIGQATAKIAQGFGMKVLAFDKNQSKELETEGIEYVTFDRLCNESDVISLHCPLFKETEGIVNKESISNMKDGVIVINTSRGPLINEDDMFEALESNKVAYYAADVVSTEPIQEDNVLLKAKNCLITPHIAWAPKAARERLMKTATDNVEAFIKGAVINSVNGIS